MATATGLPRSPPSSSARSPDTTSPIYPERVIRPLPKGRLRAKLSPEQASSIVYPPEPPPVSPALNFDLQENGLGKQQPALNHDEVQHEHVHARQAHHNHCTCGGEADSGDEEIEFDHPEYRYNPLASESAATVKPVPARARVSDAAAAVAKPPPSGSTASSVDGYDSFENTNNKKKRKIPLTGVSSVHQTQLSAELASMGISNSKNDVAANEVAQGAPSGSHAPYSGGLGSGASNGTGTGISGAGRGRYGRHDPRYRRPLGSSAVNAANGYHTSVLVKGDATDPGPENAGGIISRAIKTAAEQGPLTPATKGRENVSLLQSAASSSTTAPKTQFTFTCESDSATKMLDHQVATATVNSAGTPTPARLAPPAAKGTGVVANPAASALRGGQQTNNISRPTAPPGKPASALGQNQQPAAPPPKPEPYTRRSPARQYALQALARKKQQQYENLHHRPKPEDAWICEFCEYEEIFGEPPWALIRSYEIKDHLERKKADEKRRLLEKAKMKGRKNKKGAGKGGKHNGSNHAGANPTPAHSQHYDPNMPSLDGDEYYDDEEEEYGDEYEPIGADNQYPHEYYPPPPAPASTPAPPNSRGMPRAHA